MQVIGVDLGATNIAAGIIGEDGVIEMETNVKTPVGTDGMVILEKVRDVVRYLQEESSSNVVAIGIGTAGRVQKETGHIVFAGDTIPGWIGTEVKSELERKLLIPVFVDNDVNAAALGDGWLGAAQNWKHYAYIAIGTGLGGAFVHRGEVITGIQGGAGEIGHMVLYPEGIPCGCGQSGCAEKYVSGTALNRLAQQVHPEWDSYKLFERFTEKDEKSLNIIQKFVIDLSVVLINVQNMYDPKAIILGGGVVDSYALWEDMLKQSLKERTKQKVNVLPSYLGNKAGIYGAARLALDGIGQNKNKIEV